MLERKRRSERAKDSDKKTHGEKDACGFLGKAWTPMERTNALSMSMVQWRARAK